MNVSLVSTNLSAVVAVHCPSRVGCILIPFPIADTSVSASLKSSPALSTKVRVVEKEQLAS